MSIVRHLVLAATAALALQGCADPSLTAPRAAAPAAPRASVTEDATCTGTASSGFSPALTNENQATTVTIDRSYNCVLGASSGSVSQTVNQPALDCGSLLESAPPGDEVITWTGGTGPSTSTIHYTSVTGAGAVATYQGTVTAGRFQGDAVVQVLTITSAQGSGIPQSCPVGLGTVSRYSGTVALTITDTSA